MKKLFLTITLILVSGYCIVFSQTIIFNYTGAVQTFVVPCWMDSITIKAWGAAGGGGGADSHSYNPGGAGGNGGGGAYVTSVIPVNPGDVLQIYIGGGGTGGEGCVAGTGAGTGGFGYGTGANGGETGTGGCSGGGGGGGGSSAIYNNTTGILLLAAAGGGGGGGGGGVVSGFGEYGGGGGQDGGSNTSVNGTGGITGANATADGGAGQSKVGDGSGGGGGGGGATNGGTGGDAPDQDAGAGGGAGGNSVGNAIVNGNSQVPGNSTDPNLCTGCATGGDGAVQYTNFTAPSGGNGLVIIYSPDSGKAHTAKVSPTDTTICAGTQVNLNATGGTTYSWSPSAGLNSSTIANPVASPTATTTYIVAISNANCNSYDTVVIKLDTIHSFAGPDTTICQGNSVQLNAGGATQFFWLPASGLTNGSIANPLASPSISTTYTLTATDVIGCTATNTVAIGISSGFSVTGGPDTTVCPGKQVQLKASSAAQYQWRPATGLTNASTANPIALPVTNTTYTIIAVNASGCIATNTVAISVFPGFSLLAAPDTSICPGKSVQLSAGNAIQFSWLPEYGLSNADVANPVASPGTSTTYTVTGINAIGCSATDSVAVNILPDFVVFASPDTTICQQQSVTITVFGGNAYQWSPTDYLTCSNCAQVNISPTASVTYTIVVTNNNGCTESTGVTININTGCAFVIVPKAFSPNGDGTNDLLGPLEMGIATLDWKIYNRWGEMIFESQNLNAKWDGKYKGEDEPLGVYVWYISAKTTDGKQLLEKGNVTLLR